MLLLVPLDSCLWVVAVIFAFFVLGSVEVWQVSPSVDPHLKCLESLLIEIKADLFPLFGEFCMSFRLLIERNFRAAQGWLRHSLPFILLFCFILSQSQVLSYDGPLPDHLDINTLSHLVELLIGLAVLG